MTALKERNIQAYKTAKGTRYRVTTRYNGKRPSETYADLDDAIRRRDEIDQAKKKAKRAKAAAAEVPARPAAQLDLVEFVTEVWWEAYARPKLDQSTRENYWGRFQKWVVESSSPLGSMLMTEIAAEDILDWQEHCRDAGGGEQAIATAQKPISSAFKYILGHEKSTGIKLAVNPVANAGWPSQKRKGRVDTFEPWVIEAVRQQILHRRADDLTRRRDALFLSLMALTGARPHEAYQTVVGEMRRQTIALDETKTNTPRDLPCWKVLRTEARAYAKDRGLETNQPLMTTAQGEPWEDEDYRRWRKNVYNPARSAVAARIRAGQGCEKDALLADKLERARPYDLCRHSFIALLLAGGWTLADAADVAGHSVETLSRVYAGVLADTRGQPAIDPEGEVKKARAKRPKLGPES